MVTMPHWLRATMSVLARKNRTAGSLERAQADQSSSSERADPLKSPSGSIDAAVTHSSLNGYDDEAGVSHPLF
jgi:hypothetical protein